MLRVIGNQNPLLTRILATYHAYEGTNLVQIWVQTEQDNLNAVLCKLDQTMTVATFTAGNLDELAGFLYGIDADQMLCTMETAQQLGKFPIATGPILLLEKQKPVLSNVDFTLNPSIRELYAVLKDCESEHFSVPNWEPFYLDLSHRTRHERALSVGLRNEQGKLIACAIAAALTEDAAILTSVCVLPVYREQGVGTKLVQAMLSQLPQKRVYVFRSAGENAAFYEKLEFTPVSSWAEVAI